MDRSVAKARLQVRGWRVVLIAAVGIALGVILAENVYQSRSEERPGVRIEERSAPVSQADSGSINGHLWQNWTSCKAPCFTYFDATGTTDPDTTKPIHHLSYCFDAKDTSVFGETYNASGKTTQRETFCGSPGFAYVYETAGTYTPTLTITAEDGDQQTISGNAITVTAYDDSDTSCFVASGSDFTGCPAGVTDRHTQSSFNSAMAQCLSTDGNHRCLFKGGDTFSQNSSLIIGTSGIHIGSFDGSTKFNISGSTGFAFVASDDVRITDVNHPGSSSSNFIEIQMPVVRENILIENVSVQSYEQAIIANGLSNGGNGTFPQNVGIFNSSITNSGGYSIFGLYGKFAVVNTELQNDGSSHVTRLTHVEGAFFHNNVLSKGGQNQSTMTVRAAPANGYAFGIVEQFSEECFISDSKYVGANALVLEVGGKNGLPGNDRVKHQNHIVERNYFYFDSVLCPSRYCATFVSLTFGEAGSIHVNATGRNNVFDIAEGVNGSFGIAASTASSGHEAYNNSLYGDSGTSNGLIGKGHVFDKVKNNLVWEADGSIRLSDTTPPDSSNNWDGDGLIDGTSELTECPFTTCPPANASDFQIKASDPDGLKGGGIYEANFLDFAQASRGDPPNVGAWEN